MWTGLNWHEQRWDNSGSQCLLGVDPAGLAVSGDSGPFLEQRVLGIQTEGRANALTPGDWKEISSTKCSE